MARHCVDMHRLPYFSSLRHKPSKGSMLKRVGWIHRALVARLVGGGCCNSVLSAPPTFAERSSPSMMQNKPKVELHLTTERQIVQKSAQGKEVKIWQAFAAHNAAAQPGDILRFTLKAENKGDRAANALMLVQPIPKGTVYLLNTATAEIPVSIDYSIDSSKTFMARPTAKVSLPNGKMEERPASAETYTHVRWMFSLALGAKAATRVTYQVRVKS
jgi:uncharacterized repeat protein (TIGR01451 family)